MTTAIENHRAIEQDKPKNHSYSLKKVPIQNVTIILAAVISLTALYFLSRYNYLLFHSITEVFSIVIAFTIFAISWNSRRIMDNNYLAFIGIAFLFIAGLDLLHTLAYKGMGVFPTFVGANLATQLWTATRYLLSFSLLIPLLFLRRRIRSIAIFIGYSLVFAVLVISIFYLGIFPQAYVDNVGLTAFKVVSEYAISLILVVAAGLLVRKKKEFSNSVFKLLLAGIVTAIVTELAFTLYADVYGIANMIGHLLNVVSFYLFYRALVETSLAKPYELLFRNLKQNESNLTNRAKELTTVNAGLEKEIEQRRKELRDAERLAAIGATAGMVGHDIRNPLQAMTSDIYLAKSDLDSIPDGTAKENIIESLDSIEKNVEYVNKIVADLQDFARPLAPNVTETDIEIIFNDVLVKKAIPENIQVFRKVEAGAKKLIADPIMLKRILANLVNNAVQAMPEGGKLTLKSYKEAKDFIIMVEDTGVGIPQETRDKLFMPLFTTKSKGQGFGLAVVKRMTESLGGTVTFESEEGKGTKFILRFPSQKK